MEYFHHDPSTGTWYLSWEQDCQEQVDTMKRLQNDPDFKARGIKNGFAHYAHWPDGVIIKWMHEFGINVLRKEDKKAALKKLQDPDWKYLRSCDMHSKRERVGASHVFMERSIKLVKAVQTAKEPPKWAKRDGVELSV